MAEVEDFLFVFSHPNEELPAWCNDCVDEVHDAGNEEAVRQDMKPKGREGSQDLQMAGWGKLIGRRMTG